MSQPFYRAFEDRYRGSRDTIKERLRAYTPFLRPLLGGAASPSALDLGCGRGEWLELLGEEGFAARGIDLDEGMLAACHERGLNVERKDALAALRETPSGSLALVSSFHLVEHLPFDLVREMIAEALRALQPGGLLIMETPNPENLTVGATSFYMDPTHLHPLPPSLLSFAAEHAGFVRAKVVRLQEDPRLHTDAQLGLITVLEGVSPDYAVVAQKAAATEALAAFDASFAQEFGIALGALAQRYEDQGAARHAEIHQVLGRLSRESGQASDVLGQLRQRADSQDHRAGVIEQRLAAAEQRADMYAQQVIAMMNSRSWRITAPLRDAGAYARRLRAAWREGRVKSGLRRRVVNGAKRVLRATGSAVLRRPGLKRAAMSLLRFAPGLSGRLYALMLDHSAAAPQTVQTDGGRDLSPRAARVLRELQTLQAKKDTHAHRH
jgi:O-antigen chain-terminating methyltransferase